MKIINKIYNNYLLKLLIYNKIAKMSRKLRIIRLKFIKKQLMICKNSLNKLKLSFKIKLINYKIRIQKKKIK